MSDWWRGEPLHTCSKCLQPIIGRRFEVAGDGKPRHVMCTTGAKWPDGTRKKSVKNDHRGDQNKAD